MTDRTPMAERQLMAWFLRRSPASGARRVLPFSAAIGSETGLVRKQNEDRAAIARGRDADGRVFVVAAVADGIGGMQDGHVCASTGLASLFTSLLYQAQRGVPAELWLEIALYAANESVFRDYRSNGGTTLSVLLLLEGGGGYWASVGDSRIYAMDDVLVQLSKDDTIAGQLGKARAGSEQSKLLQYIGIGGSLEVSIHAVEEAQQGMALLTTDGVHFLESANGLLELVVRHAGDFGSCVRRLIELSRWCGGPDNASAVAIPFSSEGLVDDAPLSSSCLDVWDAFGEIRILDLVEVPSARREPFHSEDRSSNPLGAPEGPPPESAESEASNASTSGVVKAKKKSRAKAKAKTKTEGKVPQVQIQFSDKEG
ncbi:hypothetical protein [Stenotrophomonas sp.]|uniref:PP2C family protein-serine/threonine phosphatase n=1 Tax=Stenotrophomonas sp. TaxID=69392 RepID=UPI0028AD879C|nr:hypothetical protein [Stenotrophomonas sp.]